MKIWVDADACPIVIKEIIYRAAERVGVHCIFVANQGLKVPASSYLHTVQVSKGFDVADNYIVQRLAQGDLVVTADIPLASEVVAKQGWALNPRGEFYSEENIAQRLTMRNFMEEMRSTGQLIGQGAGGPPPLNQKDRQAFANELDRFLAQHGN